MSKTLIQFIKFSLVGVLNTIIDYSIYYIFSRWLNVDFLWANALGFLFAVTFSYWFNKKYTFSSNNQSVLTEYYLFFIFSSFTLLVVELVMYFGVSVLGFNDWLVKIIATAVSVVFNFIFSKNIVFKAK